jgi:hypothetical protein
MRHPHKVVGQDFTLEYEHEDSKPRHGAYANEDHDHALVVMLGAKVAVQVDSPGDRFHHDDTGLSTVVR